MVPSVQPGFLAVHRLDALPSTLRACRVVRRVKPLSSAFFREQEFPRRLRAISRWPCAFAAVDRLAITALVLPAQRIRRRGRQCQRYRDHGSGQRTLASSRAVA